jgi:hypothetical protein
LVIAWLSFPTTVIPTHHAQFSKTHNPGIEWVIFLNIRVEHPCGRAHYSCCVRDDLGKLSTSGVAEWAEVRPAIWRVTWLCVNCPARIPTHEATVREPVDPHVEWVIGSYILVYLRTRVFIKARRVTHDLRDLSTCDVVEWPERAIIIS